MPGETPEPQQPMKPLGRDFDFSHLTNPNVPDTGSVEAAAVHVDPEAPSAKLDKLAGMPKDGDPAKDLLTGSRETGVYQTPNGIVHSHEVTSDGMKQTRTAGRLTPEALARVKDDYLRTDEKHAEDRKRFDEAAASRDPEYMQQFMPPENTEGDINIGQIAPKAQKLITEVPEFEQTPKPE